MVVAGAGLPLTVQPSPSLTDFLCLPVWGEMPVCLVPAAFGGLRRTSKACLCHMTRALLDSPRARYNFHEPPNPLPLAPSTIFCFAARVFN